MNLWLSNLIAYGIQLAALAAAAAVVTSLLRLHQPRAALTFWQAVLAVALFLPAMQSWSGPGRPFIASTLSLTAPATGTAPGAPGAISVATMLAITLAAGVGIRLAWLALGLIRLRQVTARAGRPAESPTFFADLARRLGASAELRITDDVDGPATVGARRAVVLVPTRVLDLPVAVQRAILCHELIHVRRRDWISTVCEELLCAVLWFHPAARVITSRVCLARETLVDQETIALTGDRRAYAEALLAFSTPQPRPVAVTPFVRRRHFAQRVALITQEVSMSRRHLVSVVALAGIVVLAATAAAVAAFPFATAVATEVVAQEILSPGNGVTPPRVISEVKPEYTRDAMNRKIAGSVWLSVVVTEAGDVGDVEVTRSLDAEYGLDDEAVAAARLWTFEPGTKDGQAVAVRVTLEFMFTLR